MSAKAYWENKILTWETARYSRWLALHPLSWSVRARLRKAAALLAERLDPGSSVLELGCGSGFLAQKLNCASYVGIDIAENAIEQARRRVPDPRFRFLAGDAVTAEFGRADICVFLGLTDWLSEDELRALLARRPAPRLLFSFTQAPRWNPYRWYRALMDHQPAKQKARTIPRARIQELLREAGYEGSILVPPSVLNPGALVWAELK